MLIVRGVKFLRAWANHNARVVKLVCNAWCLPSSSFVKSKDYFVRPYVCPPKLHARAYAVNKELMRMHADHRNRMYSP